MTPQRLRVDDLWRQKVSMALEEYRAAKKITSVALSEYTHRHIPGADGHFGLCKALAIESSACREYRRVLEIFNALILDGKRPPEE